MLSPKENEQIMEYNQKKKRRKQDPLKEPELNVKKQHVKGRLGMNSGGRASGNTLNNDQKDEQVIRQIESLFKLENPKGIKIKTNQFPQESEPTQPTPQITTTLPSTILGDTGAN